MTIGLEAIRARRKALDERMAEGAWTLEGGHLYGLFSVYDSDGNIISHGIKEQQAFIAHSHTDIPALVAEVKRLQRELHDERVQRNKWERMCEELGLVEPEPAPDALPCGHPREEAANDRT